MIPDTFFTLHCILWSAQIAWYALEVKSNTKTRSCNKPLLPSNQLKLLLVFILSLNIIIKWSWIQIFGRVHFLTDRISVTDQCLDQVLDRRLTRHGPAEPTTTTTSTNVIFVVIINQKEWKLSSTLMPGLYRTRKGRIWKARIICTRKDLT